MTTADSRHERQPFHEQVDLVEMEIAPESVESVVARVCRRIPPLWDLNNYVAVNPFLGFSAQPLPEAARTIGDGLGAQVLPGLDFYRKRWQEGAFGRTELARAAQRAGQHPEALEDILTGKAPMPLRPAGAITTFAERHDASYGSNWNELVIRHVARWCAVYVSEGGSRWSQLQQARGLYAFWRTAALVERSLEIAGLKGWRAWAQSLPEQPEAAIETMLDRLNVTAEEREAYLYRLVGGVFGWASFLRRSSWEAGSDDLGDLAELLAIRICTDAAVAQLAPRKSAATRSASAPAVEDETVRAIFQEALEDGYARRLLGGLAAPALQPDEMRPAVQGIFCIDVRSEPFRRHLEAQAPGIETRGFAGFFGVSLDWQVDGKGSARCPVLLKPGVSVAATPAEDGWPVKGLFKDLLSAPGAAFNFVETLGLAYGIGMAGDALTMLRSRREDEGLAAFSLNPDGRGTGIALATRVEMAAGILKNMGLRKTFARIVLLCGHESQSENNPHAAGLDCGACGGHGGALNARIAVAVLNDPEVRAELAARGAGVPEDTWFVAGVHDTTVDQVRLLDTDRVPASHRSALALLEHWLEDAGAQTRAERAPGLGLQEQPKGLLGMLIRRRARDWSEVRPEWALARNAAFIAARRSRTRGVNLEGRAFLHEYDWTTDPDSSILSLILSAPVVVASWINLQYFASTVDNRVFGCGTKALHNRVGSFGVLLGNGGDLRTGLALQSVQMPDGHWFHEPLRLQVVVEAPRDKIDGVLEAFPQVKELFENGWVRLFALDPDSAASMRWVPGLGWQEA